MQRSEHNLGTVLVANIPADCSLRFKVFLLLILCLSPFNTQTKQHLNFAIAKDEPALGNFCSIYQRL